jgi:integrase
MADAAGSLRDRAIILSLWSSGVRVSTLCALDYRDVVTELENDEPHVMIPIYPEMKTRVADSCKGLIAYYTFISAQAGNSLRNYIREREEGSKLGRQDALFCSNWNLWLSEERSRKRIGRRGIELIVKKSAKLGGILQWKHVTPHCLRKSFKSILRSNTKDGGRLDSGTQEFLMGHILSGTQDAYYDKTKVDFHRDEYAKLDFSISRISRKITDKLIDIPELEKYLSMHACTAQN